MIQKPGSKKGAGPSFYVCRTCNTFQVRCFDDDETGERVVRFVEGIAKCRCLASARDEKDAEVSVCDSREMAIAIYFMFIARSFN